MRLLALPETEVETGGADREEATQPSIVTPPLIGGLSPREAAASGEERAELFVDRANQYFRTLAVRLDRKKRDRPNASPLTGRSILAETLPI